MKKLVKVITQIPTRLDGTEIDPLGRGMDWQHRDYDLAYKIRKRVRAGYGWRKILTNSAMLSVEGSTECKLNQRIHLKISVTIALINRAARAGFADPGSIRFFTEARR